MKCPKCKGNIDKKSYVCESCGTAYSKKRQLPLWAVIMCFLLGLFMLYGAINELMAFSYKETIATLISYSDRASSDEYGTYYRATFEYTVDGKTYEAKHDIKPSEREKGLEKKIYYNPNNPEKYSFTKSVVIMLLYIGISLLCLIGSPFMLKDALKLLTVAEADALKRGKTPEQIKKDQEYQELLKSLELPFPLFNKVIYIQYEDERISKEYEDKCVEAFKNVTDEQFKDLLNQTRYLYIYQRDEFLNDIPVEDYEKEGMIKDEDLDNDSVLINHLIPGDFVPLYNESNDIYYYIQMDTKWDHWDHENGLIWVFKNNKVRAYEIESDWDRKIDVN